MRIFKVGNQKSIDSNFGTKVRTNELTTKLSDWAKTRSIDYIPGCNYYQDLQKSINNLNQISGETILELSSKRPLNMGMVNNNLVLKNPLTGKRVEMPKGIEADHFALIIQKAIKEGIAS